MVLSGKDEKKWRRLPEIYAISKNPELSGLKGTRRKSNLFFKFYTLFCGGVITKEATPLADLGFVCLF